MTLSNEVSGSPHIVEEYLPVPRMSRRTRVTHGMDLSAAGAPLFMIQNLPLLF